MQSLDKTLRIKLEQTIRDARDIAERAALVALDQLGVKEIAPYSHLNQSDRDLRRHLRVHGRQLGDRRKKNGEQAINCLLEKVAYEHWHRMLFARFLAENNLLMYWQPGDDCPIDIDLETCQSLLEDGNEQAGSQWELAARFASRMLPQIFRLDSPVFQLVFPPEYQQKLESLTACLPKGVFTSSDGLGWVYQFWQAKKKDEVNASQSKIGARELPSVTQLFTEPYMVSFLLDNSLGAWWATRRLTKADYKIASSETELRRKASIPGVPLKYLRFVKRKDATWMLAAGAFQNWPDQITDLKIIDPCCGSGHFLVAAFLMLVPMRMELDSLSAREAVDVVLQENIHGLEIDQRCVELAAFALALSAWKYPNAGDYRKLPELNLACSGLSLSVAKEGWKNSVKGTHNLRIAMDWLYDTFQNAPMLGSLQLSPAKTNAVKLVQWDVLTNALERALKQEQTEEQQEVAVFAQGLAKATTLLTMRYQLVITNVPFLVRSKQNQQLRDFCEEYYPTSKNDLATVFLDRCLEFCVDGGTASVVLPQNWLFLTRYKTFREKLLISHTWHLIARLGPGAFETISGEVVKAILINISRGKSIEESGSFFGDVDGSNLIQGLDVSDLRRVTEKFAQLPIAEIKSVEQAKQLENPDSVVMLQAIDNVSPLSSVASSNYGSKPGQTTRVVKFHWEFFGISRRWQLLESTPTADKHYSGKTKVCLTLEEFEKQGIKEFGISSQDVWGKKGIILSQMSNMPFSIYCSKMFDNNTSVLAEKSNGHLPIIYSFLESGEYLNEIRKLNQKMDVASHTMVKVPFDLDRWTKIAKTKYPNGLPNPYTNDPTQWIFHGHPCDSVIWNEKAQWTSHGQQRVDSIVLQIAVARLLDYRWPAELDPNLNLAQEQCELVQRCKSLANHSDDDGIVCIPPVRGEASASDRLLNLLAAAYGDTWSNDTMTALLKSADHTDKTLESWLRDKFFTQHCKLFQHRPFIWHIWDGLRDGFSALVNYHKFDTKLLQSLIYTYLGDWINRQKRDIASSVDGSQERLASAENLKRKLELILEGEPPLDIFIRWKPLEMQSIGWNPDPNDGVRLNIRPFLKVKDVGKKGAGILRDKPNINWNNDRGKDVKSAPWYHKFNGVRVNDFHITLAEKRAALKNIK